MPDARCDPTSVAHVLFLSECLDMPLISTPTRSTTFMGAKNKNNMVRPVNYVTDKVGRKKKSTNKIFQQAVAVSVSIVHSHIHMN